MRANFGTIKFLAATTALSTPKTTPLPIARNAALLEAGLDVKVTENAKLGIAYQGQIASDAQEHGFNAKLGVRF